MECQECQKRKATLHFTQLVNNSLSEIHVCEVCAKEKGYMTYPGEGYSLHNLLAGLFNFDQTQFGSQSFKQPMEEKRCPKCNMSLSNFRRVGKFGCTECYHTFAAQLDPIFKRVHSGNTKHHGKIPKRKGGDLHIKKQVQAYKEELHRLIQDEAFEEAAKVRDKIKALEQDKEAGEEK